MILEFALFTHLVPHFDMIAKLAHAFRIVLCLSVNASVNDFVIFLTFGLFVNSLHPFVLLNVRKLAITGVFGLKFISYKFLNWRAISLVQYHLHLFIVPAYFF